MRWEKIASEDGFNTYRNGPCVMETEILGHVDGDSVMPLWNARFSRDGHVGGVEVWILSTEQ